MDFTNKEYEQIKATCSDIAYLCSTMSHSMEWKWTQAVKMERKECSDIRAARSLLIECFEKGFSKPNQSIQNVLGIRDGCLKAILIGAEMRERSKGIESGEFRYKVLKSLRKGLKECSQIRRESWERWRVENLPPKVAVNG